MSMQVRRMNNFLYVDNSNVWIEGMRVSAVHKGLAVDIGDSIANNILDRDWKIDFGKLFLFAGGNKSSVKKATLYGSRPPENDSLWKAAAHKNFEVKIFDRNPANREKKIDVQIATDILEDSYQVIDPITNMVSLVAGDGDYVPVVQSLKRRNIYVEVLFWGHASRELQNECDNFINLNERIKLIALQALARKQMEYGVNPRLT